MHQLPHRSLRALTFATALVTSLLAATNTAGADIPWEGDWAVANERSTKENRVLFLAVNMDGERANDRLAEKVVADLAH